MYPKINEYLYIQVASSDAAEAEVEYRSRIAETEEDAFLIEIPMQESNGRLKRLFMGDELSVYFLTEGGIKNYFNTYVLGFKEDVIRMVRIQKPETDSIFKIQRRSFFRVNADLELAVKDSLGKRFLVRTDDIGGGGISFLVDNQVKLEVGNKLSCWVLVPYRNGSTEHVNFEGEVVRIKKLENGRLLAMLKFVAISDLERQKIIRYCFERQFDFRNR
ncbi:MULTISPECIES: flagellar brake domain-containing protein [Paenibacillus]|uniref:Glycosyl transferase n=1 Tax=Paenibacillus odorifer TaxID=189426 RepID=A0A1R0YZY1_9BACL|nr:MULTISPECIES: flagellar brake domain-containing protein [Paenibacillus]AIQ75494.1 glycosyl transferase [Paenibacillus odorifer]ETT68435.1 type IV pilus assembly PilZ [Paenibacillus sp. FSL H8-237]MDH6427678.1 c-di-GMP-binding flagellar brake protein YcgR [Paenibacillus sp. PastH-4]MDH6528593.1 c-di-GMP-binding flagellar brake protein YcgR [Paenibacillus sp. PastH-3]MEC0132645.1 flagellar brake domain-containing protein [Paenibacillus odorifer]